MRAATIWGSGPNDAEQAFGSYALAVGAAGRAMDALDIAIGAVDQRLRTSSTTTGTAREATKALTTAQQAGLSIAPALRSTIDGTAATYTAQADALGAVARRQAELQNPELFAYFDDLKSSFSEFVTSVWDGSATIEDALSQLGERVLNDFVQRFVFEPAEEAFDDLMTSMFAGVANDNGALGAAAAALGNQAGLGPAGNATITVGTATIIAGSTGTALGAAGMSIDQAADTLAGSAQGVAATADQFGGSFGGTLQGLANSMANSSNLFVSLFGQALSAIIDGLNAPGGGLLGGLFGSLFGGGGGFTMDPGALVGTGGLYAKGAAFVSGGPILHAANGMVVDARTLFSARGQLAEMGEAGPEAIMPLVAGAGGLAVQALAADGSIAPLRVGRLPGGRLGVLLPPSAAVGYAAGDTFGTDAPLPVLAGGRAGGRGGDGGPRVAIYDQRGANAPSMETREGVGADGREEIKVFVREATRDAINGGHFDNDMAARYGARFTGQK